MAKPLTNPAAPTGPAPQDAPLSLQTMAGGELTFSDIGAVQCFAMMASERVASLLAVMSTSNEDEGILVAVRETARDLAFQVQQATALIFENTEATA